MTTEPAGNARADARATIGRALIPDKGQGGIAAAFDVLESRIRRHGGELTNDDRADVRAYLNARMDTIVDLLNQVETPDRVWSDTNG
jgi:hypothetical protein